MNVKMYKRLARKNVPPGPYEDDDDLLGHFRPGHLTSDSDTESVISGFIPVKANQEQGRVGGLNNNNDEIAKLGLQQQQQDHNSAYIYCWVPRLVNDELCIEGDLLDLGDDEDGDTNSITTERFTTGPLVDRVNGVIFRTLTKTYVLEGPMAVSVIEGERGVDTPIFIRDKFHSCIPDNWELLVNLWIRIKAKNVQNRHTMSLIYEAMLSFDSNRIIANNGPPDRSSDDDDDEEESIISVQSTKQQKELNLSIKKQSPIDIQPDEEVQAVDVQEVFLTTSEDEAHKSDKNNCDDETDDPLPQDDSDCDDDVTKKEVEFSVEIGEDSPKRENVELSEDFSNETGNQESSDEEVQNRKSDIPRPRKHKRAKNHPTDLEDYYCKICNTSLKNLKTYNDHFITNRHLSVVEEHETCPELVRSMDDYDPDMTYVCEPCKFSTDNMKIITKHTELKSHKLQIKKRNKIVLFCNLCNFSCKANDKFYIHITNKEHAKRMLRQKAATLTAPRPRKKRNIHSSPDTKDILYGEDDSASGDEDFLL